jgi:hypothetical protein
MHLISAKIADYHFIHFDEVRLNLNHAAAAIDESVKKLKIKDESGDDVAAIILYLFRGLFAIIKGEINYRAGDYAKATQEFKEGEKAIDRFQRKSTGFSMDYQQEAERLDLFAKGRYNECLALQKEASLDDKIAHLIEAMNSYSLEVEIGEEIKKPLLTYNAKARLHFIQGLLDRLRAQQAKSDDTLRKAKHKHLEAYRSFVKAAYFNPSYTSWVKGQAAEIDAVMLDILKQKASKSWGEAYEYANEGSFIESSKKCSQASKFFQRASAVASEEMEKKILQANALMLQASKFEALANEYLKNENKPANAIDYFKQAADALEQAVALYPKSDDESMLVSNRWQAQQLFYLGNHFQCQGIANLDQEKYKEALAFFEQAMQHYEEGLVLSEKIADDGLQKLIGKAISEANGYIDMCRTVID